MGATATTINLTPASWSSLKPKDYKGADLDKALAALQAARGKEPTVDKDSIASLEKRIAYLKELKTAFGAVKTAAGKTSAELIKLAKDAKDDRKKKFDYESAAKSADTIGGQASSEAGKNG